MPVGWSFLHKSDLLLQMLAREQLASQGALLDISSLQVTGRFLHADLGSVRAVNGSFPPLALAAHLFSCAKHFPG